MKLLRLFNVLVCTVILLFGCSKESTQIQRNSIPNLPSTPFNYVDSTIEPNDFDNTPANNQLSDHGAALGRVLFYDQALSISNRISCGSCHQQKKGFTDQVQFSEGFENRLTTRNTPSIFNMKFAGSFFWDMSAFSLEDQVMLPIQNHIEMGMEDLDFLSAKLEALEYYPNLFAQAFGSPKVTPERVSKALAQFVRSVESSNSKFDKGTTDDFANFTAIEKRGMQVFEEIGCNACHGVLGKNTQFILNDFEIDVVFGDDGFYGGTGDDLANVGLDKVYQDQGAGDGRFKVPSLRNISYTAPYMHDGRFATLDQVLDFYQFGIQDHPNLDFRLKEGNNIKQFNMTSADRQALKAFLVTLDDTSVLNDIKLSDPFVY